MPRATEILSGLVAAALLSIAMGWGHGCAVAAIALAMSTAWFVAWSWLERPHARDRDRRAKGRCTHCGYDLTGNISGVCPECGKELSWSG